MEHYFLIFGKKFKSYQVVYGTLAGIFLMASPFLFNKKKLEFPKINASSKKEEEFVINWIKQKGGNLEEKEK